MSKSPQSHLAPYAKALGLWWLLPAVAITAGYVVLPDHNSSGQCEGIGFGCTLPPSEAVLLLGLLAAPVLLLGGLVTCTVIVVVRHRRRRTGGLSRPTPPRG